MKTNIRLRLLASFLLSLACACASPLRAADSARDPAGHWEGDIAVPGSPLHILVQLSSATDSSWSGLIDIPAQGLSGFELSPVKIDGAKVEFAMQGVPGKPKFAGQLSADAQTIAGDFSQGGQNFPFKLTRAAAPVATAPATPATMPDARLVGNWVGTLKPKKTVELHLSLEIADVNPAKLVAVLVSIDQGNARIPVTVLTEKDGAVHFKTPRVGGSFDGRLNAEATEITGTWKQGPNPLPLVFKLAAKAAAPAASP